MSIGTNNIFKNDVLSIANMIIEISEIIKATGSEVYICAQYPRVNKEMFDEIVKLNSLLKLKYVKNRLRFIQNEIIFSKNGSVNAKLYLDNKIHLTSYGYKLFCNTLIQNMHKNQIQNNVPDLIINTASKFSSNDNA